MDFINSFSKYTSSKISSLTSKVVLFSLLTFSLSGDSPSLSSKTRIPLNKFKYSLFSSSSISSSKNVCNVLDAEIRRLTEQGKYDEAIRLSFERISNLDPKDDIGFMDAYSNMGLNYAYLKNYKEALFYYEKSLSLAQKTLDYLTLLANLNDCSFIALEQGNKQKSFFYLQKALSIIPSVRYESDPSLSYAICIIYGSLVNFYLDAGNISEAQKYLLFIQDDASLFSFLDGSKKESISLDVYFYKGRVLFSQGKYKQSIASLSLALERANALGDVELQQMILHEMNKSYLALGEYKQAHWALSQEKQLQDTLIGIKKQEKERELFTKDKENKILKQKEQLSEQRSFIIGISGSALFLLLGAGFVIRDRNQKRKYAEKLRDEEEQKRILTEKLRDEEEAKRILEEQKNKEIAEQHKIVDENLDEGRKKQVEAYPSKEKISALFPEHVLVDFPLIKVSGDFYWVDELGDNKYFSLGDIKGHGVPASYQTIEILHHLSTIMRSGQVSSPADILNTLDTILLQEFIERFSFDHPLDNEIFKRVAAAVQQDPPVLIKSLLNSEIDLSSLDLKGLLASLFDSSFSLDIFFSLLQNKDYIFTIKEDYRDGPFLCELYKRLVSLYLEHISQGIPLSSSDIPVSDIKKMFIKSFNSLLEQKLKKYEAFDMGLCAYNESTGQMHYAGAMTDLIIFSASGEMKAEKSQRCKIGKKDISGFAGFEDSIIDVASGDFFLFYSDGAVDQFGGPTIGKEDINGDIDIYGKKILSKRLHEYVAHLHKKGLSASAITEEVRKFILQWRHVGTEYQVEQIDDITLFGVQPKN